MRGLQVHHDTRSSLSVMAHEHCPYLLDNRHKFVENKNTIFIRTYSDTPLENDQDKPCRRHLPNLSHSVRTDSIGKL